MSAVDEVLEGRARWALVQSENLVALRALPRACAALVYCDPPFCTGRNFGAFDDRWPSLESYVDSMKCVASMARDVLLPEGSLVFHCDPTASHYLKVAIDDVFGRNHFASEIVWSYRRWPSKTPNFQSMHDTLLRWRRDITAQPRWNQLYEPLAESTVASFGTGRQRAVRDESGKRYASRRGARYGDDGPGAPLRDVWDMPILAPGARERTDWPTQKTVALLERLILATTHEGDLVVDPTSGSGTTLVAAVRNGRRAIGIDKSPDAIAIARHRLEELPLSLFDSQPSEATP